MKVSLSPEDLQEKYNKNPGLTVGFEHFNPIVQGTIKAAGKATFCWDNGDGIKSHVIYPPKK